MFSALNRYSRKTFTNLIRHVEFLSPTCSGWNRREELGRSCSSFCLLYIPAVNWLPSSTYVTIWSFFSPFLTLLLCIQVDRKAKAAQSTVHKRPEDGQTLLGHLQLARASKFLILHLRLKLWNFNVHLVLLGTEFKPSPDLQAVGYRFSSPSGGSKLCFFMIHDSFKSAFFIFPTQLNIVCFTF